MDKKQVIENIHNLVSILHLQGISIDRTILYGSYAYGTPHDESDIDVAFVSEMFEGIDDELEGKIWVLSKKVNIHIEPYLISRDKFYNDHVSPIIHVIRNKGVEI